MSETKEDFTKLSMLHLELDKAREMWYLGDITTLNKKITESATEIDNILPEDRKGGEKGNPLTTLKIKKLIKMPRIGSDELKNKLIDLLPVWLEDEKLPEGSDERMESKFTNFETMVTNFDQETKKATEVEYGVFYVPIDPNKNFLDGQNINVKSIITLFLDDETYKNNDTNEKRSKYLLILKDIFNIPGQGFRGAKFLFKQAMDKMIGEYNRDNPTKRVTQVATAPYSGATLDGEYDSALKNRRATFTRWGFNHIKSEPEYYGLQKFQSIPEYGIPVQTTKMALKNKKVVWGLIDYNFENVTRVKLDGNMYKIGGKSFDNVLEALKYETDTVSRLSQYQNLTLENSSKTVNSEHKRLVTSTIRHLDWIRTIKHTEQKYKKFDEKYYTKKKFTAWVKKFRKNISGIEEVAKDQYYKKWLYEQVDTKEKEFLFQRYVNYIFEIPLKQSYNEWLEKKKEKKSEISYELYKENVLYVSEEALELFKRYDNTTVANQLDTNETGNFLRDNLEIIQNAIRTMDNYDQDNNSQLDIGEFENLYQDLKFKKLLKIMPPKPTPTK